MFVVWGLAHWGVDAFIPDDDGDDDSWGGESLQQEEDDTDDNDVATQGPGTLSMVAASPGTVSMPAAQQRLEQSLNHFGNQEEPSTMLKLETTVHDKGPKEAQAEADAKNAQIAAATAKNAAHVATKVAEHSVKLTSHAKSALKDAQDALHKARVDSAGLSDDQKKSLKTAEAKLKEATKKTEYGQVKNAKYVNADADNKDLQKMETKMDKIKMEKEEDEIDEMKKEIKHLRKQIKKKEGEGSEDAETLKELEEDLDALKEAEKKGDKSDTKTHDELKAEIERLRAQIKKMEARSGSVSYTIPRKEKTLSHPHPKRHQEVKEEEVERYDVQMEPLTETTTQKKKRKRHVEREVTPVEDKGIDIDTAMPYGDLEPFGREDTAQELTESSVRESDAMVDQLERAEVAEEKRSVFRALTRLRGAAITSFDGVARSQTGNIDQYNQVHKWRKTHPMHHLANEESDVTTWAFPDDAD